MNLETYPPSDVLKPFVKHFMIIESDQGMNNHILPDISIVMAFRLKGRVTFQEDEEGVENRLPVSVVTGLRKSSRLINYAKKSATLLVVFCEGGAAAFFDSPLHELFGLHLSLDCLIPRRKLDETEERLAEAKDNRQRITIIEQFLLAQLKRPQSDRLIHHSIQKIKSSRGNIRIKDLISTLPISRDPFEKRFRRLTGTSPKQFSEIVRFRNVINFYSPEKNLTKIAHAAGFFDQSHFIKNFKSFTGQTPKTFFESPSFW